MKSTETNARFHPTKPFKHRWSMARMGPTVRAQGRHAYGSVTPKAAIYKRCDRPWAADVTLFVFSERRRADDLPAVPLGDRAELLLVHRVHRSFHHLLEQLPGPSGGVHEQHAACLSAGALP